MKKSSQKNGLIKRKLLNYDQNNSSRPNSKTTDGKQRTYLTPALSLFASLVLAEITHADWLMECGSCHCKWNSGKKTADCKNSSLFTVPSNLSPEVQVLDLSHNYISSMEPNVFIKSNLQNLHKLFVRNSSLQTVEPQTFADLRILIELDLSNNLLRILEENQFYHLVKIRAILLNNNQLESLSDGVFQDLNHLHRIELRGNRLSHVGTQVFVDLPMLSQIYLDENRLRFLQKESFETLIRLTALSLDRNPWNCSCNLEEFRHFVIERNLYTPPTSCHYPVHLRGTLWTEDNSEAFVCKPKILYLTKEASAATASKENTTLICRVHASSNTQITWNYNKQNIRFSPAYFSNRIQVHLHYDEHSKKNVGRRTLISRLTIFRAEKSDEGIYTCVAENAGGKGSLKINFHVKNSAAEGVWLFKENVTAVISIIALGLLIILLVILMGACFFYKKTKIHKDVTSHQHIVVRGVKEETPTIDSSTLVGCTNIGASYAFGKKAATNDHPNDPKNKDVNDDEKSVNIYTNSSLEDESKQIIKVHDESSTQAQMNLKDEINVDLSKQRQRWPSKKLCNNKEIKDSQLQCCKTDFQPDLLLAYRRGVNS